MSGEGFPSTRVDLEGLSFAYPGGPPTVCEVELQLLAGAITTVLGPSGCGKTTLLKLVAGLLRPGAGHVRFDGRIVDSVPAERRGAVLVPQTHVLFPHMSVIDNVAFGLRMRRVARAERLERSRAMLRQVRLEGLEDRRPAELSGGQGQRAALARALVVAPRVLLLDEPLASLDADLRMAMRDLIRRVQRRSGVTTLLVTHDRVDALSLSDRVAVLLDGGLRQVGEPQAIYRRPVDVEVARLLGPATLVPATREADVLRTPLGAGDPPAQAEARGAVWWLLRPEDVVVRPVAHAAPGTEPAGDDPGMSARSEVSGGILRSTRFVGDHVAVEVEVDGGVVLHGRWHRGSAPPRPPQRVVFTIEHGAGWLLPRAS